MLEIYCLYNNTSFWLYIWAQVYVRLSISYFTLSKYVRHLIALSFNHPKPTKGLDELSITPFWWLMTTQLKLTKRYKNLGFWVQWFMEGSQDRRAFLLLYAGPADTTDGDRDGSTPGACSPLMPMRFCRRRARRWRTSASAMPIWRPRRPWLRGKSPLWWHGSRS